MKNKNTLVWLFEGIEVGRCELPNGTLGSERRQLAYIHRILKYDNFLFLDCNGKVITEGNSHNLEGKPMGKLCGQQYDEYKEKMHI